MLIIPDQPEPRVVEGVGNPNEDSQIVPRVDPGSRIDDVTPNVLPYFNARDPGERVMPSRTIAGMASVGFAAELWLGVGLSAISQKPDQDMNAILVAVFATIALGITAYIAHRENPKSISAKVSVLCAAVIGIGVGIPGIYNPHGDLPIMWIIWGCFLAASGFGITGFMVSAGRCPWSWGGLFGAGCFFIFMWYCLSHATF